MNLYDLFKRCTEIAYTDTEGGGSYATEKVEETLYVYFEDSKGCIDWKSNFDFPARAYGSIFAHRGFLKVWGQVKDYIHKAITDTSPAKIVVVGYSHGAALAVLCHEYIWYNFPHLQNSLFGVGFGCPRVIWGGCKDVCKRWERFTVVKNTNDIVTHLPPRFMGYRHVGNLLTIGEKGRYSPIDAHRPENMLKELSVFSANCDKY